MMTDYSGQLMPQQYAIDVGQSPMQAIHTSPQQQVLTNQLGSSSNDCEERQILFQQTHMIQAAPMLAQQQMIMQQSQPIHMPSCKYQLPIRE